MVGKGALIKAIAKRQEGAVRLFDQLRNSISEGGLGLVVFQHNGSSVSGSCDRAAKQDFRNTNILLLSISFLSDRHTGMILKDGQHQSKLSNNTVNVVEPEGKEKVRTGGRWQTTRPLGNNLDDYVLKAWKMSCQSHGSHSAGSESTSPLHDLQILTSCSSASKRKE